MEEEDSLRNADASDFLRMWANIRPGELITEAELCAAMPEVSITHVTSHESRDRTTGFVINSYAFIYLRNQADTATARARYMQVTLSGPRIIRIFPPTTFPPSSDIRPLEVNWGDTNYR